MNNYLSEKLKIISFIAMILVVFLHSYNAVVKSLSGDIVLNNGYSLFIQDFISQGVTRIAVPLFFAISGYLFFLNMSGSRSEFIIKIGKRIKTLGIPYLFWSVWGIIFYYILQSIPQSRTFFTNKLIRDYSTDQLIYTLFIDPIPYQLWFIRDLAVIIVLFSPIIYWSLKYFNYSVVIVFVFLWYCNVNYVLFYNEAATFFILGSFFSIDSHNLLLKDYSMKCWHFLFLWMSILLCKTILMNRGGCDALLLDILHKTGILLGIAAIWSVYDFLFRNKNVSIGIVYHLIPFTFFLYAFHEPILTIFKKGAFYIMGNGEMRSLIIYLGVPLLTISISVFIGYVIKQFFPKIYFLATGGR